MSWLLVGVISFSLTLVHTTTWNKHKQHWWFAHCHPPQLPLSQNKCWSCHDVRCPTNVQWTQSLQSCSWLSELWRGGQWSHWSMQKLTYFSWASCHLTLNIFVTIIWYMCFRSSMGKKNFLLFSPENAKYCSFSILLIYSLEKRQTTLRHNNHTVQSK